MKKLICILLFVFVSSAFGRYSGQLAFPNLPAFSFPVEIASDRITDRLFIVEQHGKIYVINNDPFTTQRKVFIDLTSRVSQSTVAGLFGLAFHPNYASNRYFYTHYVYDSTGSPSGKWLKINRYTASSSNPDTALPSTEQFILNQSLPSIYHNGGKVAFGNDGYLYFSFGDGYSGGDPAQDRTNLLGKIMRIDVNNSSGGKNYSIPTSNPYYNNTQGFRQEIFAYGFRNNWKFSIDSLTNVILEGDVGESTWEEINLVESGKNYGWNKMEGFHCYGACDTTGRGFTRPIYEYQHGALGVAITGGYIYRGSLLPELFGKYIYADYVRGKFWSLEINPVQNNTELLDTSYYVVSFGQDRKNNLYYLSYSETTGEGSVFLIRNNTLDINRDGYIDLADVLLVYNDAIDLKTGILITDVNFDYVTDNADVLMYF